LLRSKKPHCTNIKRYAQLKKADRTNSTFGFLPTRKPTKKKPKELFFANARKKNEQ
jgi:hypothetical protein